MDLSPLFPELLLLGLAILVLVIDWFLPKGKKSALGYIAIIGVVLIILLVHLAYGTKFFPGAAELFFNFNNNPMVFQGFVVDAFAVFFKKIFLLALGVVFIYSSFFFKNKGENQGEYYALMIFVAMGCSLLVSSSDLLLFFVSFELMSIPLYLLAGFSKRDSRSNEAGLKYFLIGAITSAILLYGISLIYASLGTTDLRRLVAPGPINLFHLQSDPVLLIGVIFVLSGLAFKIAAAPFHMWVPDVYEGAPTPVVSFLAVGPKIAVIGFILRIFISSMPESEPLWTLYFAILSALSMTMGNLMALHQTNLKRLLAYSGVAQIGYILLGVAAIQAPTPIAPASVQIGYQAVLFYLVAYALTELTAFGVVTYLGSMGRETVESCQGLARTSPGLAFIFMLSLFSLAGIPPLIGFVGKFYLFAAAFQKQLYWLVILGILNSVVALFYYFRIASSMYFKKEKEETSFIAYAPIQATLWVIGLTLLIIGVYPKTVIDLAQSALQRFLVGF